MGISFVSIGKPRLLYQIVQFVLGDVPERRVPKVMGKPCSFGCIWVYSPSRCRGFWLLTNTLLRDATGDLANLQRVCEPVMEDIAVFGGNHLRDFGKTCKRAGIQNSVAVPLEMSTPIRLAFSEEAGISIPETRLRITSRLCQA